MRERESKKVYGMARYQRVVAFAWRKGKNTKRYKLTERFERKKSEEFQIYFDRRMEKADELDAF